MEQTILVVLRREDMKHLIGSCPEVGVRFIESLIKSLRASEWRSGHFWNYEERDGMRVPLDGEVAWLLPEGAKPY